MLRVQSPSSCALHMPLHAAGSQHSYQGWVLAESLLWSPLLQGCRCTCLLVSLFRIQSHSGAAQSGHQGKLQDVEKLLSLGLHDMACSC